MIKNTKNKKIIIQKHPFDYILKDSLKTRSIRVTINIDGLISVTKPRMVSVERVEKFLESKSDWILKKVEHFKSIDKSLVIQTKRGDYKKYKNEAKKFVTTKLLEWNRFYNFSYKNISIKNQKTRWGSCSKRGNLNFNYKIIFLPQELADYIVVHELCHIGELNHSAKFWNLVAMTIPKYKEIRSKLKKIISK